MPPPPIDRSMAEGKTSLSEKSFRTLGRPRQSDILCFVAPLVPTQDICETSKPLARRVSSYGTEARRRPN